MTTVLLVIAIVSAALVAGAAWGVYGKLSEQTEGFIVAMAGGALIMSVIGELVEPSARESNMWIVVTALAVGALLFSAADYWIDEKLKSDEGTGLMAAVTFDGVPESLALGVVLIGASPAEVAALAGSILLSNLPEAAGGAKGMKAGGMRPRNIMLLWCGVALLLAAAALVGNVALGGANAHTLAAIRCVAAGAVVASLATEVFPKAFQEDRHWAGVATALGLMIAILLESLA